MADTAQVGYLALARQSAMGVPNTTDLALQQQLINSHSFGAMTEVQDPEPEIGGGRDPRSGAAVYGGVRTGGDLEAALRYHLLPLWLMGAGFAPSGPPTEVDPGTGAYRHRFVYGDASPLTIEAGYGANRLIRQFHDTLVDSLSLSVEADGDCTMSASVLGFRELITASPTMVSTPASDAKGVWTGSAVQFDGLGTYRWTSAELSVENALSDDEYVLGKRTLDGTTPGERTVMLSGGIRLGSDDPKVTALYQAALNGAKDALEAGDAEPYETSGAVTFGSQRKIGTSTTQRYRAVATLPTLVLRPFTLEQSGADTLEVEVESRAYGGAVTIDVYNARSTAY